MTDKTATRQSVQMVSVNGQSKPAFICDMVVTPIVAGPLKFSAQGFTAGREFSGPITIQGQVVIPGGPPQYVLLVSDPVEINVRPLPSADELPGFTGAIGKFLPDPPQLSTNRLRVGEPAHLKIVFHGEGDLTRLVPPEPPRSPDWQIIPDNPPDTGYTLIPLTDEARETPAIPFSYFDPASAKYVDLTIPPLPVTVVGESLPVQLPVSDDGTTSAAPLKLSGLAATPGKTAASLEPLQLRGWFVGVQLAPVLGFLALWQWDRRRRFLEAHPEIVRRRLARRALRREKRALEQAAAAGDAAAFVQQRRQRDENFLRAAFSGTPTGIGLRRRAGATERRGGRQPRRRNGQENLCGGERAVCRLGANSNSNRLSRAQIGRGCGPPRTGGKTVRQLRFAICDLRLGPRYLGCRIVLAALVCVVNFGCAATNDFFAQGVELSRDGQFPEAAAAFEKAAQARPAGGTFVNLGIAEWRRGRAGAAILAWEQARWIDPFDPRAGADLKFAREAAQVDAPQLKWFEAASAWLPPADWAWLTGSEPLAGGGNDHITGSFAVAEGGLAADDGGAGLWSFSIQPDGRPRRGEPDADRFCPEKRRAAAADADAGGGNDFDFGGGRTGAPAADAGKLSLYPHGVRDGMDPPGPVRPGLSGTAGDHRHASGRGWLTCPDETVRLQEASFDGILLEDMREPSEQLPRALWLGVVVLALFLSLAYLLSLAEYKQQHRLPVIGTVADFTLTNQDGKVTTLADLTNHVWVADIIFTRCAGPCPITTGYMKSLEDALPKSSDARLVTLTTDPDYDTPAVMKQYGERFGADFGRWLFLTGTKPQIAALGSGSLKLSAVPVAPADQTNAADLFIHTTIFVAVDKHARLRGIFETMGEGIAWTNVQPRIVAAVSQLEREP